MRKNLYMLRHAHRLTQQGMAKRLGVTRTTYRNIESGKTAGSMRFWSALIREFPNVNMLELTKIEVSDLEK